MEARSVMPRDLPLARLVLAVALALCVWLLFVSTLFLVRRLSGGMAASLTSGPFLSVAFLVLAVAALPRMAGIRLLAGRGSLVLRLAFLILPALAVLAILASLSSDSLAIWSLALVWLGVAAEEGAWWTLYLWRRPTRGRTQTAGLTPHVTPELPVTQDDAAAPPIDDPELLPANLWQQITRVRSEDGGETISGVLRGAFAAGERNQSLHVAFCPPLSAAPELSFEQVDGPPGAIKAGQVESFGARLEVRLDAPAKEAAQILVEFSATVRSFNPEPTATA